MTIKILSKDDIIKLHKDLIDVYGGRHGVRDDALFDSAVNAPFQSFGGADFYPSIAEKAARLGYGLTANHPFLDGNKRIGAHAMLVFLLVNGIKLNCSSKELSDMFLSIADGTADEATLLKWVQGHSIATASSPYAPLPQR